MQQDLIRPQEEDQEQASQMASFSSALQNIFQRRELSGGSPARACKRAGDKASYGGQATAVIHWGDVMGLGFHPSVETFRANVARSITQR